MSFFDYFFAAPGAVVDRPFVGFDNYTSVLGDPVFRTSVWNIAKFMIINVPLTVVMSLVLASALNAKLPFRTFFRAAYYVPYVTASVAIVGIWLFLFNENGLVNSVLGDLAPEPSWLVSEFWAMPMIALLVTWKQMGFYVLLYLAALQNVPDEFHEAAAVDGANTIQRFFYITVPSVRPATVLVVILSTVIGAQIFTESYLLTGGGPNNASVTPVLLMYREGIEQNHPGVAAAIGVLLAIAVMALALFNRFVLERD
jgi:multiple sugar transport system permease protein